jgi:tetrahydromethanopterin S-methyltransferase subunit A
MKTVAQGAVVVLMRDAVRGAPIAGQTVAIHKAGVQAVIGIDGHTSFWDELVEVHWAGSHRQQLDQVDHVEIRDVDGNILESLPVNGTRVSYEKDGETVFFLTDVE